MTAAQLVFYIKAVTASRVAHPEWRLGQAYFNVLDDLHPEIANAIWGGALDPFYQDGLIPDLLTFLAEECR